MTVLFLGPLPPPVHGFAAINAAMLQLIQARTEVCIFDRAPSKLGRSPLRWLKAGWAWVALWLRFIHAVVTCQPTALYVGLSGGRGQLLDLPFLMVARFASLPVIVHHHSFAYVNRHSSLAAACFSLTGNALHIVLCSAMAAGLNKHYSLPANWVRVLSNAAYLRDVRSSESIKPTDVSGNFQPVRIGFLSNITATKGIFEFFEVLQRARALGLPLVVTIAGPVSAEIDIEFAAALRCAGDVNYLGAVYGDAKQRFFADIDLLLFPTRYVNEAEPLTLLEAQAAGVAVVAAERGCIAGMLQDRPCCGEAVSIEGFCTAAVDAVQKISELSQEDKWRVRERIKADFARTRSDSVSTLATILNGMVNSLVLKREL